MGAVGAVFLTLLLARGVQHSLRLLLSGVVVGVVLGALSSLVMLMAPEVLQAMQAFLLGSTGFVGWSACLLMLVVWFFSMVLAGWFSPVLDGLALGEALDLVSADGQAPDFSHTLALLLQHQLITDVTQAPTEHTTPGD